MGQAKAQITTDGRTVIYQTAKPLSGTVQHWEALIRGDDKFALIRKFPVQYVEMRYFASSNNGQRNNST